MLSLAYIQNPYPVSEDNQDGEEATHLLENQNAGRMYTNEDEFDYERPSPELADEENANGHEEEIYMEDDAHIEDHEIASIFYRLHLLFYTLCMPVVPIFVMLLALLVQLTFRAASSPPCSAPLRAFSFMSLVIISYSLCHQYVKKVILNNGRDWNEISPPTVLNVIYDQAFYLVCFMYIYFETILTQNCKDDLIEGVSSCAVSCPELYSCYQHFDSVLMIFVAVLLLPLISLTFIYAWVMKRVIMRESLWMLEGQLIYGRRGQRVQNPSKPVAKVKEVMKGLRDVYILEIEDSDKVEVVGEDSSKSWSGSKLFSKDSVKECCICLSELHPFSGNGSILDEPHPNWQDTIVQTRCGHFFHKGCICAWIVGSDIEDSILLTESHSRARQQHCPLCRENLAAGEQ